MNLVKVFTKSSANGHSFSCKNSAFCVHPTIFSRDHVFLDCLANTNPTSFLYVSIDLALLNRWHNKTRRRVSRLSQIRIAMQYRLTRGTSLALWLMRASCSAPVTCTLPENHINKIHYDYGDAIDSYGKKIVTFGKTKREIRAEQRNNERYRTPVKRSRGPLNESDNPVTGTDKRYNFLALSIMRSPSLK